jgi:DNA processing protein
MDRPERKATRRTPCDRPKVAGWKSITLLAETIDRFALAVRCTVDPRLERSPIVSLQMNTHPLKSAPFPFWYTLALTPGIGRSILAPLMDDPTRPRDLQALAEQLARQDPILARALTHPSDVVRRALDDSLAWASGEQCHLITIDDPGYPPLLRQISDPPPVIHVHGRANALVRPALAIVGSRHASLEGLRTARSMSTALARAGVAIASGLAAGIDHAAHLGALDASGVSLAVIGTGVDQCYPASHRSTADRLLESGALISELPIGSPPLPHHFPRRNRIIAGLAAGILVVQAARRSGSLITARLGLEYGREVMATPGSIQSPLHKGCHQLLREGAALVESVDDVLATMERAWTLRPSLSALSGPHAPGLAEPAHPPGITTTDGHGPSHPASALLDPWGWCPFEPEAFAAHAGLDAGISARYLLELELDGVIERLADGRLQRIGR